MGGGRGEDRNSVVWTVLRKEIRETLRDRRTILIMVVVPIFLYPVFLVLIEQLAIFGQRQLEERPAAVAVIDADTATYRFLDDSPILHVSRDSAVSTAALGEGEIEAAVVFPVRSPDEESTLRARIVYDGSRERSRYARDVVENRLNEWGDTLLAARLRDRGLPADFGQPLAVADSSVATAERAGGYALGRFLPMILIMMTVLGAFYPAIDMAAGEKERGTLEPLLTAAVPPREIVMGKFLAVSIIALTAAALNLGSMLLTFQSGLFQAGRAAGLQFTLPLGAVVMVLALLIPLAVLFSALFLGIAVRSRSFKEAQNALTPVYILSFLPALLPLMPGVPFSPLLAVVPVGGVALLVRELMGGEVERVPALLALASTVFYAGLALWFASRAFGREDVLFGSGAGHVARGSPIERLRAWRTTRREVPLAAESFALVGAVALLYFYVGRGLQMGRGEQGILLSQWLLLALPAVLFALLGPYNVKRTLALRAPPVRALVAAVLIILGGIPFGWMIGWLQSFVLPIPEEFLNALQQLVSAGDTRRFLWLLLLVAVTPAICEELVFRGVLLQGLGREMPMARAIAVSALIFGAFHLSTETVIRFLPTAWLGALLGYVVWHTRSILAAMLMHFLNNAVVVAAVSIPAIRDRFADPQSPPPWVLVVAAPVLLVVGLRLLPKRAEVADAPTAGLPPRDAPDGAPTVHSR